MGQHGATDEPPEPSVALEPSGGATVAVLLIVFLLLLANGRPIGAGDTRPTEYVAASLVQHLDLDLDEAPVDPPFAREVAGHKVSIYPVLSAVLAAPVFLAARFLFALDETGAAVAGKLAASLFSALAAAVLFRAVARRRTTRDGVEAALLLALGTSVASTSQALWQHPLAVLALCATLLCLLRAAADPVWAGRAGLPLCVLLAARHADVAIVVVLAGALAVRWPRQVPWALRWAAPVAVFQLGYQWWAFGSPLDHGFSGSLGRFSEPWGVGHLGLLVSPAKGLLVFTPAVILGAIGLVRALRSRDRVAMVRGPGGFVPAAVGGERWIAAVCGIAFLAHWILTGRWSEWHGGESWGPRLMTDALPLLILFLPDGLDVIPRLGALLCAISVAIQALGAFSYDYRWERLFQRPAPAGHAELWALADSPIPFHAREHVLILAAPVPHEGRIEIREHRIVPFSGGGSRVEVAGGGLRVTGSDATFTDVHALRGARVVDGRLRLQGRWDGLFLRLREASRPRKLELRISGRGEGTLYVAEQSFRAAPRFKAYPVSGAFRIRHPYSYPESGGDDLVVTIGKAPGTVDLAAVSLVPPGEPDQMIRLDGSP